MNDRCTGHCAKTLAVEDNRDIHANGSSFSKIIGDIGNEKDVMEWLEPMIILHTQEVRGSSPCAPTILWLGLTPRIQ